MDEQTPGLEARERAAVAEVVTAVLRHDLRNRFSSIRNASYYLMRQAQKTELWKADPRMETFFQLIDRELVSAEEVLSTRGLPVPEEDNARLRLSDVAQGALARVGVPPSVRLESTWQERALVQADAARLTLLIRCVVENAVEAMPRGGLLSVRTLRTDEGRVVLEVSDTGPGIPEELRARVFEPFMTTKPGHAGLGLCIVQRLALRCRAWVELQPSEPVGTRVRVSFPISEEAGAASGT
jgi:signal transduction histidine kinase